MINLSFYGIDPYLLRGLSKDLTKPLANLCECKEEDILFVGSECLICHDGVEQNTWYSLVRVELPDNLHSLESKIFDLIKTYTTTCTINVEVYFIYYHLHSKYVHLNPDYPRFIDESNEVIYDQQEINYEEDEHECDHDHEHDEEELFEGNAFEGFEDKINGNK